MGATPKRSKSADPLWAIASGPIAASPKLRSHAPLHQPHHSAGHCGENSRAASPSMTPSLFPPPSQSPSPFPSQSPLQPPPRSLCLPPPSPSQSPSQNERPPSTDETMAYEATNELREQAATTTMPSHDVPQCECSCGGLAYVYILYVKA